MKIDVDGLEEGAEAWYTSLTPSERAVFLQALWECEGEPTPRTDAERKETARLIEGGVQ